LKFSFEEEILIKRGSDQQASGDVHSPMGVLFELALSRSRYLSERE